MAAADDIGERCMIVEKQKRKAGQRIGVNPLVTVQVRLDKNSIHFINRMVRQGKYQSRSEMIRWAVKKLINNA